MIAGHRVYKSERDIELTENIATQTKSVRNSSRQLTETDALQK